MHVHICVLYTVAACTLHCMHNGMCTLQYSCCFKLRKIHEVSLALGYMATSKKVSHLI